YLLRTGLLKLRYALSPATTLTLTGYSGTSWDDKSGNGDNDFLMFDQQLYTGTRTIAGGGSAITDPATTNTFSCQPGKAGENGNPAAPGIAVLTNAGPACYTAQQFARASNGPAGGGGGPFQAIRNQDYHARLQSMRGHSELTLDAYRDNYAVDYNRNLAGGLDPTGKFYIGGFDTTFVRTTGYLASDDIVSDRNDFGFGVFALRQDLTGTTYDTTNLVLQPNQALGLTETNFFVRDVLDVSPRLHAFFNGWLKHTTVTGETKVDPRLSLVYRASPNDVVRLTGGNSSSAPTPSLRLGTSSLNQTPQNITPNCGGPTGVGGVGNPAVSSETGSDVELAVGHRFHADSLVQLSFYRESLNGKIFNVSEPISALGANAIPPNLLAGYVQRLQQ
ncbi:MAG: hypothetical protein ACREM8_14105, partial [Vulcanimicrobiaceae bacterium]